VTRCQPSAAKSKGIDEGLAEAVRVLFGARVIETLRKADLL
jgi:hypothetical protein